MYLSDKIIVFLNPGEIALLLPYDMGNTRSSVRLENNTYSIVLDKDDPNK